MSDTAEVGIRVTLIDMASAAADTIKFALQGIADMASPVTDGLNLITSSLLDVENAAYRAVLPLDNLMTSMSDYADAATELTDSNKVIEDSIFNLSDDLDLLGQTYQMYQDNASKAIDANSQLVTSLSDVGKVAADQSQALSQMGQAAKDTADAVSALGQSEDDEGEKSRSSTNDFMAKLALYQSSQQVYNQFSSTLQTAITNAGNLQEALTNIQIATGSSDKAMQGMENTLIAVANNSKFTAVEVGNAFTLIGERGYSASDIINKGVGQAVVNFAEAVHGDLIPSTTLLTSTMQVFGAKAQDAERYASALTYAFYNGIPDVTQLQEALANVAGEAHALNIPIEDVTASLDFLVRNGLSASTAGNSLRYMLTSLTDPTSKASQELAALGIESINASSGLQTLVEKVDAAATAAHNTPAEFDGTVNSLNEIYTQGRKLGVIATDQSFYQWAIAAGYLNSTLFDTQGNLKPLPDMLGQITTAINALPDPQQKMAALGNLFNVRSGQGALQFVNNPNSINSIQSLSAGERQAEKQDLAGQDAKKIMADFNSQLAALATSWNTFIGIAATPIIGAITPLLSLMNNLILAVKNSTPAIGQFIAGFLLFGTLGAAIGLLAGMVFLFGQTGVLLAGGVIAAVIGFATLGGLIYANWNSLVSLLRGVGNAIVSIAVPLLAAGAWIGILWGISAAISSGVVPAFFIWLGQMGVFAVANAADIASVIGLSIAIRVAAIPALISMAAAFLIANWPIILFGVVLAGMVIGLAILIQRFGGLHLIMTILSAVWHQLVGVVSSMATQIRGQFMAAIQQLQPTWQQLVTSFNQARPFLMALGVVLGTVIGIVLALGVAIVMGLLNTIAPLIGAIIGLVAGIMRVFMGLVTFFMGFFTLLGGIFTGNGAMIQQGWASMGKGLYNIAAGIWDSIKAVFTGAFGAILGFFGGLGNSLAASMTTAMHMMGAAAQNALNVVLAPFKAIVQFIHDHLGFHSPTKEGLLSDSDQYMPNFMKMMASGITSHKGLVTGAMQGLTTELAHMSMPTPASLAHYQNIQAAVSNGMSNSQHTTNLYVDSKKVATANMDLVTGQLQMQGLGRAWR